MTPTPKAIRARQAETVVALVGRWRSYILHAMVGGFTHAECPRPLDVAQRLQDQALDALFYELNAQGWVGVRWYLAVDKHNRECAVFEWEAPIEAEEPAPVDNVVPLKPRFEN